MKNICLTYLEPGVRFSKYLVSFFRMIGLYTYERVLMNNQGNRLKHRDNIGLNKLLHIFIVTEGKGSEEFDKYIYTDVGNAVYLVHKDSEWKQEIKRELDENKVLIYDDGQTNTALLKEVLGKLFLVDDQFCTEKENLLMLAEVFETNHIAETLMGTRHGKASYDIFNKVCQNYDRAIDQIVAAINREGQCKKKDFLRFAITYLAYEYNYYCHRLKREFLYDASSLLTMLKDLRKNQEEAWSGLDLLEAQIYGDLQNKPNNSLMRYEDLVSREPYMAFAYYRMAYTYEIHDRPQEAFKFYRKAAQTNPGYYCAVYKFGKCCLQTGDYSEARRQYRHAFDLIGFRSSVTALSPVDARYIFKTYIGFAGLEIQMYDDTEAALQYYGNAVKLWEQLSETTSPFAGFSGLDAEVLQHLFRSLKESLSVEDVFSRMAHLYNKLGNWEMALHYKQKK